MSRALARAWVLVTASLLVVAGTADAAITASSVTSPGDPTFFTYDTTSPGTIPVSGTVTGTGAIDLLCYRGTDALLVQSGIPTSGGAFSADVDRSNFPTATCVLRAVTTTTTPAAPPGSPSPFAGPVVGAGSYEPRTVASGPNAGHLYDFFLDLPQQKSYTGFLSVSGCGQSDGALLDPVTLAKGNDLWACMDYIWWQDRQSGTPTRSQLQVDGVNTYLGYAPANFFTDSDQLAGLPDLTASYTQNPTTGDLTLTERAGTVTCAANAYPPSSGTCGSFSNGAVAIDRTTTVDHAGLVTRITTTIRDVSHQAHHIDVQFDQDQNNAGSLNGGFQFPGESGFSAHADGDTVLFPSSPGPASVLVKRVVTSSDGDDGEPKGSITLLPAPSAARFYEPEYFHLDYALDLPADGAATFDAVYTLASTVAGAQAGAAEARDRIGTPVVTITNPAEGATVASAAQTVTGTAVDAGGAVTSLTLNGQAVSVGADGSWSAPVTLAQGPNQLVAVAGDAFGNKATATRNVTYTPPLVVPLVKDTTAPSLTAVSLSARTFAVGKSPTAVAIAALVRGTKVRWTVNEAGTTTFAIKRVKSGRRKGSRCLTGKSAPRHGRRCTVLVAAGSLRRTGGAGKHVLAFSGRIGRRALAVGRYRMDVTARDADGNRSARRSVSFKIVRAKKR